MAASVYLQLDRVIGPTLAYGLLIGTLIADIFALIAYVKILSNSRIRQTRTIHW